MARLTTLSGQIVTVDETKGTTGLPNHWFTVSGTAQGIVDFLNENRIPQSNVMGMAVVTTTYFVLYHK